MIPGPLNLPVIWRGADYPAVTLVWKDANGNPFNLAGWTPHAKTNDFDLNAEVTDATNGVTKISLTHTLTSPLKLGVRSWDWTWENENVSPSYTWPPFLSGKIEVKQALSTTQTPVSPPPPPPLPQ